MKGSRRPGYRLTLWFGWRRRCPHCGRGPLFERWLTMRDRCAVCQLRFLPNQGDAWGFLLLIDRACFIFPVIVALYFRLHAASLLLFSGFAAATLFLLIYTTPHRQGLCVALNYLTRVRWPDPSDPLPPFPSP